MVNYNVFRIIIAIFVATMVGLSVSLGAIFPTFLAILIGTMLSYIYKWTTKEVLEDERIVKISEKSSRRAITLFSFYNLHRIIPYNFKGCLPRFYPGRIHPCLCHSGTNRFYITSSTFIIAVNINR